MTGLRYTAAIPTLNRPQELRRCLECVLVQTPPPEQILVIDDGALDLEKVRGWLGSHAETLRYRRKTDPGLVGSMNLAIDLCETEWLLFLDDDIYLDPDFLRRIDEALALSQPEARIAGIAGYPLCQGRKEGRIRARARGLVERLFLLRGSTEGRFLPSSFLTNYEEGRHPDHPYPVEHVPGGLGFWRAEILKRFHLDPWYTGYAAGLDQDLSYRVSREHRLICQPAARALHAKSPHSRANRRALGEMRLRNQMRFFRRHFAHPPYAWILFGWALAGQMLLQLGSALGSSEHHVRLDEFRGMVDALRHSFRRREEHP